MIAKDMGKYSYIYGDNSHLRVRLAANSIHFAVQGSKAIAEYLEDVDALIAGTTNDLLKELLKVDKDSGFINACRQMNFSGGLTSSSDLAKIAAQMDAHAKTVASTGDGFKANKLQYSDVQYKQVKELDAILKGDVATLKIGKIDMSKSDIVSIWHDWYQLKCYIEGFFRFQRRIVIYLYVAPAWKEFSP